MVKAAFDQALVLLSWVPTTRATHEFSQEHFNLKSLSEMHTETSWICNLSRNSRSRDRDPAGERANADAPMPLQQP
eukprot:4439895-Amphidinium_carterae.2